MTSWLSVYDDVMLHQVAGHPTRAEHPEYSRGAGAVRLRIAPRLGASDLGRLGRIKSCHALEQQSVVLRCKARPSAERVDLDLRRRCGQENAGRERNRQAMW